VEVVKLAQVMLLDPADALKARIIRRLVAQLGRDDLRFFVVAAPAEDEDELRARLSA
jgi:hypothetical protein